MPRMLAALRRRRAEAKPDARKVANLRLPRKVDSELKALVGRQGTPLNLVAIGRSDAELRSRMVKLGVGFVGTSLNAREARNAPRWLQMLVKHGFVPTPA